MTTTELVAMGDQLQILQTLVEAEAITPVSLDLSDDMPFDRYEALGRMLGGMGRSVRWWVGDWLVFGEATMGDEFAQAAHATGLAEGTLLNYRYTAERVPKSRRRHDVAFSLHTEVAPLPAKEQRKWLTVAAREQLTQKELRERIRETSDGGYESSANGSGGGSLTVGAGRPSPELEKIARDLWSQAKPDHDGWYRVPNEVMARLGAALGEED